MSPQTKQVDGPDLEHILDKHGRQQRHVLAMLHEIQNQTPQNYIREKDLKELAEALKMPYSNLHGVVTFYSMFSTKPRGKYIIRVCESGPCTLMGSDTVFETLMEKLDIDLYQTTDDGLFTLEPSSCLGICGVAPAMMVNQETFGNLTPDRIDEIITEYQTGEEEEINL